jgi:hypothetical protein
VILFRREITHRHQNKRFSPAAFLQLRHRSPPPRIRQPLDIADLIGGNTKSLILQVKSTDRNNMVYIGHHENENADPACFPLD